jgi:hypothetical protein
VCRCKVNYIQSRQKDMCLKGNQNHEPCISIYPPFPISQIVQWFGVIIFESILSNVHQIPLSSSSVQHKPVFSLAGVNCQNTNINAYKNWYIWQYVTSVGT